MKIRSSQVGGTAGSESGQKAEDMRRNIRMGLARIRQLRPHLRYQLLSHSELRRRLLPGGIGCLVLDGMCRTDHEIPKKTFAGLYQIGQAAGSFLLSRPVQIQHESREAVVKEDALKWMRSAGISRRPVHRPTGRSRSCRRKPEQVPPPLLGIRSARASPVLDEAEVVARVSGSLMDYHPHAFVVVLRYSLGRAIGLTLARQGHLHWKHEAVVDLAASLQHHVVGEALQVDEERPGERIKRCRSQSVSLGLALVAGILGTVTLHRQAQEVEFLAPRAPRLARVALDALQEGPANSLLQEVVEVRALGTRLNGVQKPCPELLRILLLGRIDPRLHRLGEALDEASHLHILHMGQAHAEEQSR
eukprot:scaffold447_cov307-Pinguiococcus_pyrenoidosus.AAC.29